MKIVVLCGGLSTERKISIISGTNVCTALRERGHQAVLVDLFMGLEDMGEDIVSHPEVLFDQLPEIVPVAFDGQAPDLDAVRASRKDQSASLFGPGVLAICKAADVVFMALHGLNGEDGRIQAAFDLLGIPYTGSGYLGAALGMDKILTKQLVAPAGVLTPAWHEYHNATIDDIPQMVAENPVPCVVKTPTGGSTIGVYIIKNDEDLIPALNDCLRYGGDVLIEQFIQGHEFTNAVLLGKALPCVEINPPENDYDYSNKYTAGATEEICPGRLPADMAQRMGEIAVTVHNTLGLRTYSRSDFLIDEDNNIWFLEVNTLPGMTPTSLVPQEAAAAGISYGELCEIIINDGLRNCGR